VPSDHPPNDRATELAEIVNRIRAILLGDESDGSETKQEIPITAPENAPHVESPEPQPDIGAARARLLRLVILADKVFGDPAKRVDWLTKPLFGGRSVADLIEDDKLGTRFEEALNRIYAEGRDGKG